MAKAWKLTKSNKTLGLLELKDIDQPWFMCTFRPTESFSEVKQLFERELATEDAEDWDVIYQEIMNLGLLLEPIADNEPIIREFLLHIQANEAWFRY